jgi:hypothetical protein
MSLLRSSMSLLYHLCYKHIATLGIVKTDSKLKYDTMQFMIDENSQAPAGRYVYRNKIATPILSSGGAAYYSDNS